LSPMTTSAEATALMLTCIFTAAVTSVTAIS
jgi:hypothetical protein